MEKIPNTPRFEDVLRDRFKSLPKTMGISDQIFNYISGGYEACDNASLKDDEIESIVKIVKEAASTDAMAQKSSMIYQESAKKIEAIIDTALER